MPAADCSIHGDAFRNQVVEIDHDAVLPQKSVRVETGIEHETDDFPAVVDRLATRINRDGKPLPADLAGASLRDSGSRERAY